MRKTVRFFAVAVLGGAGIGICVAALIPSAGVLLAGQRYTGRVDLDPLPQRTTIYAADGSVIGQLGLENRTIADLKEIPKVVIDAVIATEDKTFYDNPGVDFEGTGRALLANLSSGEVSQGGSTITQQLVKNRILTSKRDLQRKVREMILAYRLNEQYTKNQILREYLNTVYFGQGSYGIKSAAERFFGKDVSKLDLSEAALLAGVISSPEYYNPFLNPAAASKRRAEVLKRMVDQDYINQPEADNARNAPLPAKRPPADLRPDNYFVEEVQRRLLADERLGATAQERYQKVLRGGLKVYTTFDARAYFFAQLAVNQTLPKKSAPFTAAVASMDPSNGEVRAIVGGPGFEQVKFNLVTQGTRQEGSTFKAITLAAAIEAGYSPNDSVDGTSPCSVTAPPWGSYPNARNAEPGGGVMSLRHATEDSVNCAYVRTIAALGPDKVVDMAHRLGIKQNLTPLLSMTLGTEEATPLEMATVFATLADDGVRHDPIFVKKVLAPDDEVVFEEKSTGVRAVSPQVARTVTDMLRGVITSGTGTRARLADGRVAAGKTGTTDSHSDAWFCGYTPQLVTVVWMGDPTQRTPMRNVGGVSVFGGSYPARIWKAYMDAMLAGAPKLDFLPPDPHLWPPARAIVPGKGRTGRASLPASGTTTSSTATTTPGSTTPTTGPPESSTSAAPPSTEAPPATEPPAVTTAPPPNSAPPLSAQPST